MNASNCIQFISTFGKHFVYKFSQMLSNVNDTLSYINILESYTQYSWDII